MVTPLKAKIPIYKVKLFYRTYSFSKIPTQYTMFMILYVFTRTLLYNQNFYIASKE